MLFREVFIHRGEESVYHSGTNVFAEWRVVLENVVSLSVSPFGNRVWLVS